MNFIPTAEHEQNELEIRICTNWKIFI